MRYALNLLIDTPEGFTSKGWLLPPFPPDSREMQASLEERTNFLLQWAAADTTTRFQHLTWFISKFDSNYGPDPYWMREAWETYRVPR